MAIGLGKRFKIGAGSIRRSARREWRTGTGAVSARHGQVRVLQRAARIDCVVHDAGQLAYFVALALQQHGQQPALCKGRG
jgi:hypothetical protein